ncbi:MAG: DUF2142 domain-containing protein [Chloroflexi bacterium]|nr:DUF2142 domain-containing protein [Chloroflexota bacterium]
MAGGFGVGGVITDTIAIESNIRMNISNNLENLPYHWLLPLLFFAIGLLYWYASPNFEASDTKHHVGVIEWIARHDWALPVQSTDHGHLYGQEASQPPLYYLLMTPIWQAVDTSDFDQVFQQNPLLISGVPLRLGNRNEVFYRQPYPPDLQGASLALYLIRLATLGMASVTIYAICQSARAVLPDARFVLLAASLAAFNPMFIFISASVSNDPLVSMFAALVVWQALVMLRDGFATRRSLMLGILIALATLSKLGGLALAPLVALAGLWLLWRGGDRRGFIILVAAIGIALLLICGWWFARNLTLYGELFGTSAMLDNFGRRDMTVRQLVRDEFEGLRISYWALFGAFSILVHDNFYRLMDALSLLGAVGLPVALLQHRRDSTVLSAIAFLGLLLAVGGVLLIWWTLQTTASTGRLLFPYITSISLLMALGLRALRVPSLLVALPMLLFCIAAPFAYIMPHYDHPPTVARLPESASETFAQWNEIRLVGYELPAARRWSPGDEIPLTLFWQPTAQSNEPHALFISLIDAEGLAIATIDTFPGWGSLPTTAWQPQVIYRDDYIVQIPEDARAFSRASLHIGWYAFPDGSDILPRLATGEVVAAFTLPVGALVSEDARRSLDGDDDALAEGTVFGDSLRLNRYRFSEGRLLELEWQLISEMSGDWRVFAMAFDRAYQSGEPFEILLQKDAVPAVPLDYLRAGETFFTRHEFELPPGYAGEQGVYVGWYNDELVTRLPLGRPDNMLLLPDLRFDEAASPAR